MTADAQRDRPVVAISMGEPAGIGPELVWAAWRALRDDPIDLVAVGDPRVLAAYGAVRLVKPPFSHSTDDERLPVFATAAATTAVTLGAASTAHAPAVIAAIDGAVALAQAGAVDAVTTMPIAKSVLQSAGFAFPGHTEYLAHLTQAMAMDGPRGPVMMLAAPPLKVALATIHVPLARVADVLTPARIEAVARVVDHALRTDFGLTQPRLALCGLNPHAGEDGALGREEIAIINPAAAALRAHGVAISNARAADSLFHAEARAGYDAVIALYHDQGLIPIKTLAFWDAVNVTLGLPIVRTSPDHGVGFDIAAHPGQANPASAIAAIRLAAAMARRRRGH